MTAEPIIDLDDHWDPLEEPKRLGRNITGRPRWIAPVVLALACVAAFSGAAPTPAPALTRVGVIDWPNGALRDGRSPILAAGLVISEVDGEVAAYHPDGRLAWRSRLRGDVPRGVISSSVYTWEGSILLLRATLRIATGGARVADMVSIALDPATGQERWRINGVPERGGNDLILVTGEQLDGTRNRAVYSRLPDGLLWTVPPARTALADAASDALLTITDEGLFTEYQLSTGKPRRSTELRLPRLASVEDEISIGLVGDRVILRALKITGPQMAIETLAYHRATLRLMEASPLDRFLSINECGPVLCASTFERTYILDRDNFGELWHTQPGEFPTWTTGGLLIQAETVRLVDERTGRDRMDLDGWAMVTEPYSFPRFRPGPPGLVTRQVGERTYFARLTPSSGTAIRVLGAVPRPLEDCHHLNGLLACRTADNRTEVWQFS